MGATALTESWSALAESSNNHMMLGHLMEWFYAGLGGIYQETGSVAYREIILAPKPVGEIKWVKCSFRSPNGIISTDWKIEGDTFLLKAVIPEDASAKIIIPENYGNDSIEVRGVNSQEPVDVIITDGAFRLASGTYEILTK